jgi:hypothetical protein
MSYNTIDSVNVAIDLMNMIILCAIMSYNIFDMIRID